MNIAGYRVEELIGKGGMAMVYRAIQESLERPVALKVMNPLHSDSPESSQRFLDEGRLLASLRHSNIITIHDIGISSGLHFIAMEYVEGGDLRERIERGMSPEQATDYLERLAGCLSVAHDAHIVHRDIKPANILFRDDGTLLLTDFGIAKQLTADRGLTVTGSMVGSLSYMSPEQATGTRLDGRADIYSLGILFYEMLVGELPFKGESGIDVAIKHVREPMPELPDGLARYRGIVDRMTRKDPEERFPSCKSLLAAIRELKATGSWSGKVEEIPLPPIAVPARETPEVEPPIAATPGEVSAGRDSDFAMTGGDTLVDGGADSTFESDIFVDEESLPETRFANDETPPKAAADTPSAPPAAVPAKRGLHVYAAAAAAAALLIVVGWLVTGGDPPQGPAPSVTPSLPEATAPSVTPGVPETVPSAAAPEERARWLEEERRREAERVLREREARIAQLARDAERALREYRLTTPRDSSAYSYYRQILELDPNNAEARRGIDEIAAAYYRLAKSAERNWDYDLALRHVRAGLEVRPEDEGLHALRRSLEAERGSTERKIKKSLKKSLNEVKRLFQ